MLGGLEMDMDMHLCLTVARYGGMRRRAADVCGGRAMGWGVREGADAAQAAWVAGAPAVAPAGMCTHTRSFARRGRAGARKRGEEGGEAAVEAGELARAARA